MSSGMNVILLLPPLERFHAKEREDFEWFSTMLMNLLISRCLRYDLNKQNNLWGPNYMAPWGSLKMYHLPFTLYLLASSWLN